MSGITTKCYRWCLVGFILVGAAMTLQAKWLSIHNDFTMYDTDEMRSRSGAGVCCKFGDYITGTVAAAAWPIKHVTLHPTCFIGQIKASCS